MELLKKSLKILPETKIDIYHNYHTEFKIQETYTGLNKYLLTVKCLTC